VTALVRRNAGLALVLVTAGLLRGIGLAWGEGHPAIHPDERHVINMVSRLSWQDPNPHDFAYGSLPLYLLRAVGWLGAHALDPGFESYGAYFLMGRLLSWLASLATVWLVFVIGRQAFGRGTAVLAAAFLALCVLHIQLAHFYTVESLLVLGVTASFWACLRVAHRGRAVDYALAGVLTGMSVATKLSALPLGLVLVVAHALSLARRGALRNRSWLWLAAAFSLAAAAFIVCEPFAFTLSPVPWFSQEFLRDFWEQSNMVRGISKPIYVAIYENTPRYLYPAHQLVAWGMGPPLALTCGLGTVVLTVQLARRGRAWLAGPRDPAGLAALAPVALLLAWLLPNAVIVGGFAVKFLRYQAPLLPFLCLAGAVLLVDLQASGGRRLRAAARGAAALVLGYSLVYALAFASIFLRPHTHIQADRWYAQHARAGARVIQEHWDASIPYRLPETPPFETLNFPSHDPDSPAKLERMARILAEGDYFVSASNRIYATVLRWPQRWPRTARLYERLLAGELGYAPVARFASPPRFLFLAWDDSRADESFINYDHPTVLILENRERLTAAEIRARVEAP
jgi:4-amino-4-deoxy-L-arabinose transferase-like glycosyltransferase